MIRGSEKHSFNIQQHEKLVFDVSDSCLMFPEAFDSQNVLCQSSEDNTPPQFRTVADSFLSRDEDTFWETYSEHPCHHVSLYEHLRHEHNIIMVGDDSAPVDQTEGVCATSGNSASSIVPTKKKRIKWTKDLHDQFVAAVNSLGGPQKAKPRAVLKMMDSKSLNIFHVKSHLQKYRTTQHMQNIFKEGYEEKQGTDMITELQQKIYMQIEESRQLQLEVRRSIQEQLEIQRNLQMIVEQKKKQLNSV
ncbi:hypothetical protein VNO77_15612 [Canavalia gladiata]|uniref:HTH myb-type domain-containing protein n=1 Tax=Canavalia gladiata TaxID=3824 RepID=A0AAN9LZP4_CANGL